KSHISQLFLGLLLIFSRPWVAMAQGNSSEVTEFFLLGFDMQHRHRHVLFMAFLLIYVVSMVGNVGMILLIKIDSRLKTPMYFFLQHLAFVDLCYTSAITPKMLQIFLVENKSISFRGCAVQLLVYATFATTDCYLLAAMAVDRYVAICNPLRYPIVMSQRVCIQLIAGSYSMGSINSSVHTGFTFSLLIPSITFSVMVPQILSLSCSNIDINIMLIVVFVGFNLMFTVSVVIFSYIFILAAILRMSSATGRRKAFSTCASHLTVVTIFYGTLSYMYLQPRSNNSEENMKAASVCYGIVIPMLNPLIYSLRNKEQVTEVTEFIFLGFANQHKFWHIFFIVFLMIYGVTLVGNIGMILLIKIDSSLKTPMYFLLQSLAFVDLCYSSAITPKMLQNFVEVDNSISFVGCIAQILVYATFATTDCYILAVMAVDRYVAICNPLRYPTVMTQRVCIQLLIGSYIMGFLNSSVNTGFTFSLNFCKSNKINHFFCDEPPILALSCSSIDLNILLLTIFVGFNLTFTVSVVIFSYIFILAAILRMSSAAGRKKAFSTCASHLTAVTIFYGTLSYMYLHHGTSESQEQEKMASVFYGIIIPMLNPLIYSLRNQDVKQALKGIGKNTGMPCPDFMVFRLIYVVSMLSNIGMGLLIKIDSRLDSYHLAFVDLCYTSVVMPKMLQNFRVDNKSISFSGCAVQLLVYATFATTDCYLLAAMAVDRYVAICNPLRYPIVMSQRVCIQLIAGSYIMGSINSSVHTGFTFSLSFCKSNAIRCLLPHVGKKTFSTCASHLTVVTIFYGTLSCMYLQPHSSNPKENMK
ncbi:putative olfactory receptor 5AK3, partial [Galemys pyrenaicus]